MNSKLKRRPVQGVLAGVVSGIAHSWGLSRFWLRLIALALLCAMPLVSTATYLLLAWLLPRESTSY